jgi:hypothetical protein
MLLKIRLDKKTVSSSEPHAHAVSRSSGRIFRGITCIAYVAKPPPNKSEIRSDAFDTGANLLIEWGISDDELIMNYCYCWITATCRREPQQRVTRKGMCQ